MAQSQQQAQTHDRGWLSNKQVAALSSVIGSIYDQMLLAFNRSLDNLESHDQTEVTDESGVVHQMTDAVHAVQDVVQDTLQDAGRVVVQHAPLIGHPSHTEVEQAVQEALNRLGIPSRARVEKISHELDELNDLLDQELAARRAKQTETVQVKADS